MDHRRCPGYGPYLIAHDSRTSDACVAARLADLAIAAAFAGGLGVGGELGNYLPRAAELLGGEAERLGRGDALLIAQVLADGVAEVPGAPRVTATRRSRDDGHTPRAA